MSEDEPAEHPADQVAPRKRGLLGRIDAALDGDGLGAFGCCLADCLFDVFTLQLVSLLTALARPADRSHEELHGVSGFLWRRVRAYQVHHSALRPAICRLEPTCSGYAQEVLVEHGAVRGTLYTVRRLLRCGRVTSDPVPGR
jgi:uncharacterized protein